MKIKEKVRIEKDDIMEYSKAEISAMKKVYKILKNLMDIEAEDKIVKYSTHYTSYSTLSEMFEELKNMIEYAESEEDE